MIGPGTGVAPFRAFVQHRREHGDRGRSWLFFGERRFTHDDHLLPRTRAYREIWLEGEKIAGGEAEDEPIYGKTTCRESSSRWSRSRPTTMSTSLRTIWATARWSARMARSRGGTSPSAAGWG